MDNQYNYYNPNENSNNEDRQRMNSQSEGSQNGEQKGNTPQWQPGGDHLKKEKKPHKNLMRTVAVVGFAILFGVVSSGIFLTTTVVGNRVFGLLDSSKSTTASSDKVSKGTPLSKSSSVVTSDVSEVVDQVMPSIVSITSMSVEEVRSFFGGTYEQQSKGAGTGIIIGKTDTELLIVTNNHVVAGSDTLTVAFTDESTVEANIKGTDAQYDVAVIAVPIENISDDTLDAISVATLGDSTSLKVGEPAIAIGNALGYGQSVTTGVISAVNREVALTDKTMTLLQTSAAINPGNSGGALLNGKGEVIGMNTVKYSDTSVEGMGYAIPINTALETAKGIIDGTIVAKTDETTAFLGITGGTLDEDTASAYNAPAGIYVSNVASGSAAQRAGLQAGCIITGFNGEDVSTMEDLQKLIQNCAPGDSVTITAQFPDSNGNYSEQTLTTIMGSKADAEDSSQSTQQNGQNQQNGQYGQGQQYGQ